MISGVLRPTGIFGYLIVVTIHRSDGMDFPPALNPTTVKEYSVSASRLVINVVLTAPKLSVLIAVPFKT